MRFLIRAEAITRAKPSFFARARARLACKQLLPVCSLVSVNNAVVDDDNLARRRDAGRMDTISRGATRALEF